MKRLIAILALSTAFGVAACEDTNDYESEVTDVPMEAPIAPAAEEASAPVDAPSVRPTTPDSSTLPPEKRSSEESVQPESETLFY